ncbi:MAG: S-layer homology domain-containing protein, partial [Clostridia bacterium]|nr:S-layer homology domain-containing protein [Clostridia bacterium]
IAKFGLIKDDSGKVYPKRAITRGEFVKMLVSVFGVCDTDAQCDFADVKKESDIYKYVATLYQDGVVKGISDTAFGVDDNITRQDMVTIIYRFALKHGIDLNYQSNLDFNDSDDIADYAKESVSALVGAGAVNGDDNHCFLPKKISTFAETCKIIYYLMLKNT